MRIFEVNEMTNCRRDAVNPNLRSNSPIVETFSALVNGKSVEDIKDTNGKKCGDRCVNAIKELNAKAASGDLSAISEMNSIRSYVVNPLLLEELKLLGFFGGYEQLGYDETIERKVIKQSINTRGQALNGDVPFSFNYAEKYNVPSTTLAAGYEVDYRKAQFGDMSAENTLIENIKTDMRNKASAYAFNKVISAVTGATIKNVALGVTRQGVQGVINKARPFGKVTLVGDTSAVIKLNDIATYADSQVTPYMNITQDAMNEIAKNAYISNLMGATVYGVDNAYDLSKLNSAGTWFDKVADDRYIFVVPTGITSPIQLWTRGGLTSMTGTDVSTGRLLTRYDLEVAADVAKGEEYKIGLIDTVS